MIRLKEGRVIVGVDGSLTSLRALRQAVVEARRRGVELRVVHVRPAVRPSMEYGPYGPVGPAPWEGTRREVLDRSAADLIDRCLRESLGAAPADITVCGRVAVGRPETELVDQAWCDDDLLVVGTRGRRRWRLPWRRSVSKYCIAHCACPVLVVPPDGFTRAMRSGKRWHRSMRHGDVWKQFDATARHNHQTVGDA